MTRDSVIISYQLYEGYTALPFTPFRILTLFGITYQINRASEMRWRSDRPIWVGIKVNDTWTVLSVDEITAIIFEE